MAGLDKVNRPGYGHNLRTAVRGNKSTLVALPFLIFAALVMIQIAPADVGSNMRRGNHLEQKGEYEEALENYQKALVEEPDNPSIHYNIGRVLYRMDKYDEAIGEFQLGLMNKERDRQSDVFYNIGNSQFKKGQLESAIDAYKMSLLANPKDLQAKQNLEFCFKLKEQLQNQQQSDSTQQQPDEQPQPQPEESEIGKEQAERVLQAMQNKEKENLEKARVPERKETVDKDW